MSSSVKPSSVSKVAAVAAVVALSALFAGNATAAITCTFQSVPGVAFGAYDDSSSAPTDITSFVDVLCSRVGGPADVTLEIAICVSANTGQVSTRALKNTASSVLLYYNLYRDTGHSQVWGVTSNVDTQTTSILNVPNNGSKSARVNIYGRITALQNATVGIYGDSLSITVSP